MAKGDPNDKRGGCLVAALSLLVGVPLLVLSGLTIPGPPSPETMIVILALLLAVVGGIVAPWRKYGTYAAQVGYVAVFVVLVWRFFAADAGVTMLSFTGPEETAGRWVDRLVPERDVAIGGSALLLALGRMPPHQPGLLDSLRDGYDRMRQAEGPTPSPVVGTFVFGQAADSHSLLRVRPPQRFNPPGGVVVFLHGFIGNVGLLCWQVGVAATPVGLDVVCPSTGWEADWSSPDGVTIVQDTIAHLRGQGVERIYLAGLSAGAIGVSRLAGALDVEGVVLISGASSRPRPSQVPTLVLQGRLDRMTPPGAARAYARQVDGAEYIEHPGAGHWLILSEHEWVTSHLRAWLDEREGLGLSDTAPGLEDDDPDAESAEAP